MRLDVACYFFVMARCTEYWWTVNLAGVCVKLAFVCSWVCLPRACVQLSTWLCLPLCLGRIIQDGFDLFCLFISAVTSSICDSGTSKVAASSCLQHVRLALHSVLTSLCPCGAAHWVDLDPGCWDPQKHFSKFLQNSWLFMVCLHFGSKYILIVCEVFQFSTHSHSWIALWFLSFWPKTLWKSW